MKIREGIIFHLQNQKKKKKGQALYLSSQMDFQASKGLSLADHS
jgi:hypothetical protein